MHPDFCTNCSGDLRKKYGIWSSSCARRSLAYPQTRIAILPLAVAILPLAVAILLSGSTFNPWRICDNLKEPKSYEALCEAHDQKTMQAAIELQAAIDNQNYQTLFARWRDRNITAFKLEIVV